MAYQPVRKVPETLAGTSFVVTQVDATDSANAFTHKEWGMIWKRKKRHKPSGSLESQVVAANHLKLAPHLLMEFRCPRWPPDWPEIELSILEAVRSGDWGRYQTAIHEDLRRRIENLFAMKSARLVSSGTAAIEIALRAAGVGPGDEVAVAAFDYLGNFRSVEQIGARPVLIDVHPNSFSISPSQLRQSASPSLKAVIASHLYGHPAAIASIRETCSEENWVLIEDACQVPGMRIDGQAAGSFGDLSAISFGGGKPLTAGCGGAILANQPRYVAKIASIVERPSDAFSLSTLQAAALIPQFERLATFNHQRACVAEAIARAASRFPSWQVHWACDATVDPAYYKLAFTASTSQQRARIVVAAEKFGLPIGAGFRSMHNSSSNRCRKPVDLSHSERLSETLFVLDHRALLVDETRYEELIEALTALHAETRC